MIGDKPVCPACWAELEYPDDMDSLRTVEVLCCNCLSTVEITEVLGYETRVVEDGE